MTHTWIVRAALVIAGAMCVACSDQTLAPSAFNLDGNWTRADEVPGSSEQWSLSVQGSSIAGTGTWSGEACCAGSLTAVGTIDGDSVHIDVTVSTEQGVPRGDFHEQFDGTLISSTVLRGTLSVDRQTSATVEMHRVN